MAGERRQCRRAGVPTEMVELVALVGHRHRVDDLAVCGRAGLHVDHRERVGVREVRAEQQGVGEVLRRSFHRKLRGCVEGRIRPHCHWSSSLFASRACSTFDGRSTLCDCGDEMRLAATVLHNGSKAVEQSHDWPAGGCYAVTGPCCFAGERYQSTAATSSSAGTSPIR